MILVSSCWKKNFTRNIIILSLVFIVEPTEVEGDQGRIQDFNLEGGGGGGARNSLCQHAHYERGNELAFGRGPGPGLAYLWGPKLD